MSDKEEEPKTTEPTQEEGNGEDKEMTDTQDNDGEKDKAEDSGAKDEDRDKDKEKDKDKKSSRKSKDKDKDKDKDRDRRRRRSRSKSGSRDKRKRRSRSRSRDKKRRSRDRDRDRGGKDRDRSRRSGSSKRRSRSRSPEVDPEAAAKKAQEQAIKEERERNRDDYTVFVSQIHPKVDERDLFEFFSHVGRVEDIRLIRDQRTHKSKGLCYVEFWERESVPKAVTLTGQLIGGYPITIAICQSGGQQKVPASTPMRLYVGDLHLNVSDSDLKPVFEAFGPIDFVEIHKDDKGASKGFGFVQFKNETDARAALQALNGLEIAGKAIKVGMVDQAVSNVDQGAGSWGEDEETSVPLTAQGRADLMAKLGGRAGLAPQMGSSAPSAAAAPVMNIPVQPTTCIIIKNMFDPKTETELDFDLDIKEDVEEEAVKFGPIKHIFVDKNSAGHVYLRYHTKEAAEKLRQTFHGRWFATRQISAEFVIETTYSARFPDSNK